MRSTGWRFADLTGESLKCFTLVWISVLLCSVEQRQSETSSIRGSQSWFNYNPYSRLHLVAAWLSGSKFNPKILNKLRLNACNFTFRLEHLCWVAIMSLGRAHVLRPHLRQCNASQSWKSWKFLVFSGEKLCHISNASMSSESVENLSTQNNCLAPSEARRLPIKKSPCVDLRAPSDHDWAARQLASTHSWVEENLKTDLWTARFVELWVEAERNLRKIGKLNIYFPESIRDACCILWR